ncbi:MAG TPA: putative 2OG-Fe(II) oxygenase [Dokdonella sp.]|jgi:uncharacterized protein (TIGR02466 family)|nr:putative 2OG-Fe(II) oxygenase [Dokdonella sp.]
MSVFPLFSVPFVRTKLNNPAAINAELRSLFLKREAEGASWRNPQPTMPIPKGLYESKFDLFSWPDRCVQQLHEFCMLELFKVIGEVNAYKLDELRELESQTHAWFHVTRRGGLFSSHNHPMASWSGVYCVDAGSSDPGETDSGVLHFQNPHQLASMYTDPANNRMIDAYSLKGCNFHLAAGELVLFPSWLFHEVSPFKGTGERITVAFNTWFRKRGAT